MKIITKLGYQCPKEHRTKWFNYCKILSDWADNGELLYNKKHKFVFNERLEREKLYNAQPCIFTDKRFSENSSDYIYNKRRKEFQFESMLREIFLKIKGIPKGTLIKFGDYWYDPEYPDIDNSYIYKVERENPIDIQYEISKDVYFKNFTFCQKSQDLTNALRQNGFLVSVHQNTDFLIGTIDGESEIAIAYGYGKIIGFSSLLNTFRGYVNGETNILFEKFGQFDKWSYCREIPKSESIENIIAILKTDNRNLSDD